MILNPRWILFSSVIWEVLSFWNEKVFMNIKTNIHMIKIYVDNHLHLFFAIRQKNKKNCKNLDNIFFKYISNFIDDCLILNIKLC